MDLSFLYDMEYKEFYDLIMAFDDRILSFVLPDEKVRGKMVTTFTEENFKNFIVKCENVINSFLDKDTFTLFIKGNMCRDKLYIVLSLVKELPDHLFTNKDFINLLGTDVNSLKFKKLNYDSALRLFRLYINKSEKKYQNVASILNTFNASVTKRLMEEELRKYRYNTSKVMLDLLLLGNDYIISSFDVKIIPLLKKLDYSHLRYILDSIKEMPSAISHNEDFINIIASIQTPFAYRSIICVLEDKMDTSIIEKARRKYVRLKLEKESSSLCKGSIMKETKKMQDYLFSHPSDYTNYEDLFSKKEYENFYKLFVKGEDRISVNEVKTFFLKYSHSLLIDYITDYLFGDLYHNVCINIRQMLRFLEITDSVLIEESHITLYERILQLEKMSNKEMLSLFDLLKQTKMTEMFYDDMRQLKDISYKSIADSSINLSERDDLFNKRLTNTYGVPIYKLNGQDFKAIVRCHAWCKDDSNDSVSRYNNERQDGYSFSLIGSENIITYFEPDKSATFLFSNIDYRNIVHVCHMDSFSSYSRKGNRDATKVTNEIHTASSLLENSEGFTEIVIENSKGSIKPDALVCYDEIGERDTKIAKKMNIPILLIMTKYYEKKEGTLLDTFPEEYIGRR